MHYCPSAFGQLLRRFRPCFTAPAFCNFTALVVGWLLLRGTRTISRVLQVMRHLGWRKHHASAYRFFTEGRWSIDALGRVLVDLLRPYLSKTILAIVDDTLCAKSGRQLFGTGIHLDTTRSVYSRGGRRVEAFAFGHQWVVLAVQVPCPWNPRKGWAVPVLFRLYRPPRRCPAGIYRKRSELAREMIGQLARWLSPDVRFHVAGDSAYCCKTVLRGLPASARFVGPLPLNAALYDTVERPSGRGRPRRKGYRIASPRTRLQQSRDWQEVEMELYGRKVCVQLWSCVCLWYHSAGAEPVRVVVTRDPRRRDEGRAYVSTDADLTAEEVLAVYARRWQLEVCFRDLKQELGLEDPRNGWWRRPPGKRDDPCRPAQRRRRGRKAVERTAPLVGLLYGLVLCWYLDRGTRDADLARARNQTPWNGHKDDVSFADMLTAFRRASWLDQFRRRRSMTSIRRISQKLWVLAGNAA